MADWRREGARRRVRYWAAWLVSPLVLVGGLLLMVAGLGARDAALIAGGAAVALAGFVWGTALYIRVVDEQERDATLWASYAGICLYFALFVVRMLPVPLHHPPLFGDTATFAGTMVGFFAVFCWKRFR